MKYKVFDRATIILKSFCASDGKYENKAVSSKRVYLTASEGSARLYTTNRGFLLQFVEVELCAGPPMHRPKRTIKHFLLHEQPRGKNKSTNSVQCRIVVAKRLRGPLVRTVGYSPSNPRSRADAPIRGERANSCGLAAHHLRSVRQ